MILCVYTYIYGLDASFGGYMRKAGRNSTTLSVRIPFPLYYKIKHLALQKRISVNDWAKRCMISYAHYIPDKDDPVFTPKTSVIPRKNDNSYFI
jgi:hypothetical protein